MADLFPKASTFVVVGLFIFLFFCLFCVLVGEGVKVLGRQEYAYLEP